MNININILCFITDTFQHMFFQWQAIKTNIKNITQKPTQIIDIHISAHN